MKTLYAAALALGALVAAPLAHAADWTPPGPIKLMIAFAAGGGADTQARLIAEELEKRHGWTIIPEQVTGKGGLNLAAELKDAPADGTAIGMAVTETLGYNMASSNSGMTPDDFTGITTTAGFQMGVVAKADKGWTSFDDMIADAGDGSLRFGTMSPRLADLAYLIGKANGVDFNIVEVKGGKAVMNGVNAGDLDLGFMAGIQRKGVASGDLVNLASAMTEPLVQTPDAPTMDAIGVPFDGGGAFLILGPAGMPDDAREALATAIGEIVSDPETKAGGLIAKAFGGAKVMTGDALTDHLKDQYDDAGTLMKAASE